MYARLATILLLLLMSGTMTLAAGGKSIRQEKALTGTDDEQAACAPDVTKFCNDKIPDTLAVLACLQSHRQRLSKACRDVLKSNGQ